MPALITHYLHAREVFDKLDDNSLNKAAFLLGAQGPDFLYFHRALPIWFGKSRRNVGTLLHRLPPDKIFSKFARYCASHNENKYALSYASGFLCHYIMDADCHPFVYAQQRRLIKRDNIGYFEGFVHSRIEHSLDIIMLKKIDSVDGNKFDFCKALTDDNSIIKGCSTAIADTARALTNEPITAAECETAFRDMSALQKFSRDRFGIKYALTRGAERIVFFPRSISTFVRTKNDDGKFDYANLSHTPLYNPYVKDGSADSRDFIQLFYDSERNAQITVKKYIENVKSGNCTIDFTGNRSCKTGQKISDNAEFDDTYDEKQKEKN